MNSTTLLKSKFKTSAIWVDSLVEFWSINTPTENRNNKLFELRFTKLIDQISSLAQRSDVEPELLVEVYFRLLCGVFLANRSAKLEAYSNHYHEFVVPEPPKGTCLDNTYWYRGRFNYLLADAICTAENLLELACNTKNLSRISDGTCRPNDIMKDIDIDEIGDNRFESRKIGEHVINNKNRSTARKYITNGLVLFGLDINERLARKKVNEFLKINRSTIDTKNKLDPRLRPLLH